MPNGCRPCCRQEALEWEAKYQDYRALAEGLRVQFYWSLCGLADDVADHYIPMQRDELDWIGMAIHPWPLAFRGQAPQAGQVEHAHLSMPMLRCCVVGKLSYLAGASPRHQLKAWCSQGRTRWVFGASLLLAAPAALLVREWLSFIAVLAPVAAFLVLSHAELRAYSAHARRYRRAYMLFNDAGDRLLVILQLRS